MSDQLTSKYKHNIIKLNPFAISHNNKNYFINIETRGDNTKFWFDRDQLMYKDASEHLLFGNDIEVLASRLFDLVGLNCANYTLASYKTIIKSTINKITRQKMQEQKGVITTNFKMDKPKDTQEISGYDLLSAYFKRINRELEYECTGHNTIEYYIKSIKYLFPESDISALKSDLHKMALADYLIGQTDRHAGNLSFLKIDNKIELAPIFDNAYSFFAINDKDIEIWNSTDLSIDEERTKVFNNISATHAPSLGIKAPVNQGYTFKPAKKDDQIEPVENDCICNYLCNFEREMAIEILHNDELAQVFKNFQSVNIRKFINYTNAHDNTDFDEVTSEWISQLFEHKTNRLANIIEKQKSIIDTEILR